MPIIYCCTFLFICLDIKLIRSDGDIFQAVRDWYTDKNAAEVKFGNIKYWDVSKLTTMKELLYIAQ